MIKMNQITTPPRSTDYGSPWVLVSIRPGRVVGKRPPTQFMFIIKAIAVHGHIVQYMAIRPRSDGSWTKTLRRIEPKDILREWRNIPSDETVRKARRALKPVVSDND